MEVTEEAATSTMEGQQQIVRVHVTCKVDTDIVARQIDALRKSETLKAELLKAKQEADRLRKDLDDKTRELAVVKSEAEAETIAQTRRKILTGQDVNSLLERGWVALAGPSKTLSHGSSSSEGRQRARILTEQALTLDASNPKIYHLIGTLLLEEADLERAIAAFRMAIRLKNDDAVSHNFLGKHFG